MPQVQGGTFRQIKMKVELGEAVDCFIETLVWPDELISLKARYKFFIVAMQTEGEEILQKLSTAIETQMDAYPDADYSDIQFDLAKAKQAYDEQLALMASGGRTSDDSLLRFENQDNNIDRHSTSC